MLANRRRSERRVCTRLAKIHFGAGSLPRDCTITDISDGGVKVVASRVRANLALVVGLQGKQAEAETIVKADLPPDQAAAKVTALRQLLAKKQQRAEK
ncbi:hypothetical protein ABIF66_002248 [Bradyrhizobium japonicum]